MCTVSFLGDAYARKWTEPVEPQVSGGVSYNIIQPPVTREEFEALRQEVEFLKSILIKAKAFDEATGQPDCEMEDKIEVIRQVADMVGIDLDEVFGSAQ